MLVKLQNDLKCSEETVSTLRLKINDLESKLKESETKNEELINNLVKVRKIIIS